MQNKKLYLKNIKSMIVFFVIIYSFLFFVFQKTYSYYQQPQQPYFQTENLYSEPGAPVAAETSPPQQQQVNNNWGSRGIGNYYQQQQPYQQALAPQMQPMQPSNYEVQDEENDEADNNEQHDYDDSDYDEDDNEQDKQSDNDNGDEGNNITVGLVPVVNSSTINRQSVIGQNNRNNNSFAQHPANSWAQQGIESYDEQQNNYGLTEQTVADVSETIKMSFLAGGVGFMAYRIGSWVAQKFAKKVVEKGAEDAAAESAEGAVDSAVEVAGQEALEKATQTAIEEAVEQAVDEAIQATVEETMTAAIEAGEAALEDAAIAA